MVGANERQEMKIYTNNYFALITGASSGIGKAIAEELCRKNMNLLLVALPDSGLEKFAEYLERQYSARIKYFPVDLTELEGPRKVYDFVKSQNITVDTLINNAGIGSLGLFEKQEYRNIDDIILLNIRASTLLTRLFVPDFMELPAAYILNMSSFGAFVPIPFKSVYAASKSYLLFFTEALRMELKNTNIRISSMHPSGVPTNNRLVNDLDKNSYIVRLTTLSSEEIAKEALKNLYKGKDQIIPGFFNRLYFRIGFLLPYGLMLYFLYRIFSRKHKNIVIH